MVKATELRIGNWILSPTPRQVVDVLCDSINTLCCNGLTYDMVEPIPLTEEILLKCGFEFPVLRRDDDNYDNNYDLEGVDFNGIDKVYSKNGNFYVGLLNSEYVICYENAGYDEEAHLYSIGKPFKYLHEFQNIYFWLEREELKITL